MADPDPPHDAPPPPEWAARRSPWPRRIGRGLAWTLAALMLVLAALYLWLGTDSGRRFAARQVEGFAFENGLSVEIDRIEGSLFGGMRIHGLALRDPRGVFLTAPLVELDWRPLRYATSHLDIRALLVPTARLHRTPAFRETASTEGPLLPDLDIDVNRLEVGRLRIDPPVTGRAHLVSLSGRVHIADRRARLRADARALRAPGVAGGDRLAIRLDAVPDDNRLDIEARMHGPADGLIAGLAGVERPVDLSLAGKGDWQAWNGRLTGRSGDAALADIVLRARDGRFALRGTSRPGLFLEGMGRDMLEPVTRIDVSGTAAERRVRLDGSIGSDNFLFAARGLVDLGHNRMQDLQLDFRLLKPSVIAENLRGDAIAASVRLDGDFASPRIDYALNARRIGFGATLVEGLSVSGSAALDEEQWRIPLHGRATRITGVNAGIAPLLTQVRLDGDFAYADGRLLSDNLRLRSDRIDATAVIVADLDEALYTGALQGRVNGYRVESVGIFNLDTRADLKTGANGYFRLAGRITARSTRLFNDSIGDFLGGNALIVADVGYDSNGVASIDRLRVAAPDFRLAGGSGRYSPDGAIRFSARGSSDQYGPLGLEVSGTAARPVARLAAARPGLGVGLVNLTATIRGTGAGYAVQAKADSDHGPLTADVGITTGPGPLRVAVRPGTRFAGVSLEGRISQTAAGPFTGTLSLDGSGIDGTVALSSLGGHQRALVKATARDASLPGPAGLAIDRAIIDADIVLLDRPQIVADVQLAGTRMGDLHIAAARAAVDYRGGQGQARLLVEGRTRYPFRLAANARMRAELWQVALDGRFNGIDIETRSPLAIVPEEGGAYVLRPSRIAVGDGTLWLAGRYGRGVDIQSRLEDVNLALANPFIPGLGIGGTATGSLDFSQPSPDAFPRADARLRIDDFTRTSITAVSEPVDIHVVGRLLADGGNARALIRRRGAAVGRLQVDLRPLPPGAGYWTERLLAAPLSGGLRYNGPADVLFSLSGLPDQSLTGPVGVAADFSGRVQSPRLTGVVRANNLSYRNAQYGTHLSNMRVRGRFTNDRLQVEELSARAGEGTISGSGFVSLSSAEGFPIQLGLNLDRAQLADSRDLATRATGQIRVVNSASQPATISGRLSLPETHYRIVRQGSARVARLTGVRRKPTLGRERITGDPDPVNGVPSNWRLDVDIVADNQIHVTGMGLNSEWAADIHVGGTTGAPAITGGIRLVRGTLGFAGRSFDLAEGRLRFSGARVTNPTLNIVATGEVEDVTITVTIAGTGEDPQISFASIPSLPQDELMARILFGNSVGELSTIQAVQLAASLNSLRGGSGGLNPLGVLQSSTGIDRIRILGADEDRGRGTSLALGQYISNDVYVEIVTDVRGYTATQLEISLSRALSILSEVGSFGGSSVNLRYRKDY